MTASFNPTTHSTYFTTLPRDYYLSPSTFEVEVDHIWMRQWLYFGHISQLPEPGSVVVRDLLGESVVLVRDGDREVRGFLNICRHRGYPICDSAATGIRRLTCPYHQWSYALNGQLLNAPTLKDGGDISYADWNLHDVHVDVWEGFLFVCLGPTKPIPLSAAFDMKVPQLARIEPAMLKQAHVETYRVRANWKLVLENFLECFHCPGSHPEFCAVADIRAINDELADLPPDEYAAVYVPLRQGANSLSADGDYVSRKLLGDFGRGAGAPDGFNTGFLIQPALTAAEFTADYGVVHEIRPCSPGMTDFICRWFVHRDAEDGIDFDRSALISVWDATNTQDVALVERTQRGVTSRRFLPGPLSPEREPGIRTALTTYLRLMEAESASVSTSAASML